MNKIISSAIAVSAITVSTVFGLTLVNVNSSKALGQTSIFARTEKRVIQTQVKPVTGPGVLKHVCKSKTKRSQCSYKQTVKFTDEWDGSAKIDIKLLETTFGVKRGREYSYEASHTVNLDPNTAVKIYVAPIGQKTKYEFQEKQKNGDWVTKESVWVTRWTGGTTNDMPCTHSSAQGGCGY